MTLYVWVYKNFYHPKPLQSLKTNIPGGGGGGEAWGRGNSQYIKEGATRRTFYGLKSGFDTS